MNSKYRGHLWDSELWTSEVTLIELLLLAKEFSLDPAQLLINVLGIAKVEDQVGRSCLSAANYIERHDIGVFDALHAAHCGRDQILSSDKVFDKLGLDRIPLKP